MNPFMVWVSDHLGTLLVVGLVLGIGALVLGARDAWKTGRKLRTPQRPVARFVFSIVLLAAGAGATLLFSSGLVQIGPGLRAQRGMVGQPAPELAFSMVESDRPGRLADYRGRVVLVNVWATWCAPCRHEMPELDRLQTTYADDGLVVLHVSDEDRETLLAWIEERPASTVHAYAQPIPWPESGRPTTYVVDRDGTVQRVLLGQRSYEQFEAEIERYL